RGNRPERCPLRLRREDRDERSSCRHACVRSGMSGIYAMPRTGTRRAPPPSRSSRGAASLSRRQLLAGAGAGAAALLLGRSCLEAQTAPGRPVVFAHTTVVTVDAVQDDVALAVNADKIVAIGPTDSILRTYA